jgi:hypothetical protein
MTVGGEIHHLGSIESLSNGFWLASFHGSYHPRGVGTAFKIAEPFVTAGLSFFVPASQVRGFLNAGAGFHWWYSPRAGLRFEVRDQIVGQQVHFIATRVGIVFR